MGTTGTESQGKLQAKWEQKVPNHKQIFKGKGNNRCRITRKALSEMGTTDAETRGKL
jgi:hypothetical protein